LPKTAPAKLRCTMSYVNALDPVAVSAGALAEDEQPVAMAPIAMYALIARRKAREVMGRGYRHGRVGSAKLSALRSTFT
jgi:hypothetical protein